MGIINELNVCLDQNHEVRALIVRKTRVFTYA